MALDKEPTLILNGVAQTLWVPLQTRLLDYIRDEQKLTGSKEGCSEGECGACTVLLDGKPVNSCLLMVGQVVGKTITTIEALADSNAGKQQIDLVQRSLLATGGAQCGICTPGVVLTATALLLEYPQLEESEIREKMAGNLCRCTGYQAITEGIKLAQVELSGVLKP